MRLARGSSNRLLATTFLVACGLAASELGSREAAAEQASGPGEVGLPPVDVTVRPRPPRRPRQTTTAPATAPAPAPTPAPTPADQNIQSGSAGTVGYLATRTSTG